MDNFTSFLKKAQKKELESLSSELDVQYEQEKSLHAQMLEDAQAELHTLQENYKKQKSDQERYAKLKQEGFARMRIKNELVKDEFFKVVKEHIDKKAYLVNSLKTIEKMEKGTIFAGESFSALKSIKTKHMLKQDATIAETGYIFENNINVIDARLSTYFSEIFTKNKTKLLSTLFN